MRILITTPLLAPEIGGPATHVSLCEKILPAAGHPLSILPFSKVRHLPPIVRHIHYACLVYRAAKNADLIYTLDAASVGFPSMIAARLAGKPYVLRVAGDFAWEQGVQRFGVTEGLDAFAGQTEGYGWYIRLAKKIQRTVALRARSVVVPSKYFQSIVEQWGVPSKDISVVYSTVPKPPVISQTEARETLGINSTGTYILSAGRLVAWKGFMALLGIPVFTSKSASLGIAGDGPDREKLEEAIEHLTLEKNVHLLGQLSHADLMLHIAAADVFVLNTGYEAFSHQLVEVMHAGVPIVTTPVGGNTELITDHKTGLLVEYNDTDALEGAIRELMVNKSLAHSLSEAARRFAGTFTEEGVAKALLPILTL